MFALPRACGILTQDQKELAPAFRRNDQQRQLATDANLLHQNRTTAKGEESKVWKIIFFLKSLFCGDFLGKETFSENWQE